MHLASAGVHRGPAALAAVPNRRAFHACVLRASTSPTSLFADPSSSSSSKDLETTAKAAFSGLSAKDAYLASVDAALSLESQEATSQSLEEAAIAKRVRSLPPPVRQITLEAELALRATRRTKGRGVKGAPRTTLSTINPVDLATALAYHSTSVSQLRIFNTLRSRILHPDFTWALAEPEYLSAAQASTILDHLGNIALQDPIHAVWDELLVPQHPYLALLSFRRRLATSIDYHSTLDKRQRAARQHNPLSLDKAIQILDRPCLLNHKDPIIALQAIRLLQLVERSPAREVCLQTAVADSRAASPAWPKTCAAYLAGQRPFDAAFFSALKAADLGEDTLLWSNAILWAPWQQRALSRLAPESARTWREIACALEVPSKRVEGFVASALLTEPLASERPNTYLDIAVSSVVSLAFPLTQSQPPFFLRGLLHRLVLSLTDLPAGSKGLATLKRERHLPAFERILSQFLKFLPNDPVLFVLAARLVHHGGKTNPASILTFDVLDSPVQEKSDLLLAMLKKQLEQPQFTWDTKALVAIGEAERGIVRESLERLPRGVREAYERVLPKKLRPEAIASPGSSS